MDEIRCSRCNQLARNEKVICLYCGAALPPTDDANDPWSSNPFPMELRWIIGFIVLNLLLGIYSVKPDTLGTFTVLVILLDLLTIVGLKRRIGWVWHLALGLWFSRLVVTIVLLDLLWTKSGWEADSAKALLVASAGLTAIPIILLIVCRARGAYLVVLEGEKRTGKVTQQAGEARPRKRCSRCADPCPEIDNLWTRAGFCSKRCMEKR